MSAPITKYLPAPGAVRAFGLAAVAVLFLLTAAPPAHAVYGDAYDLAETSGPALPGPKAFWAGTCDLSAAPTPGDSIPGGVGSRSTQVVAGYTVFGTATFGPAPLVPEDCIDPGVADPSISASDPWTAAPSWRQAPVTQSGAHPDASAIFTFTRDFDHQTGVTDGPAIPAGSTRDIQVQLPAGLAGNPQAVPRCSNDDFEANPPTCPASSQVGVANIQLTYTLGVTSQILPVYNLEPLPGRTAEFGIPNVAFLVPVRVYAKARTDGDFGITTGVERIPTGAPLLQQTLTFWGVPWAAAHDLYRPQAGTSYAIDIPATGLTPVNQAPYDPSWGPIEPFFSNPTSCPGTSPITTFIADTWQNIGSTKADGDPELTDANWITANSPAPPVTGCEKPKFDPSIGAQPTSTSPDAPSGLDVEVSVPQNNDPPADVATNPDDATGAPAYWKTDAGLATAHLHKAVVTLPKDMTVNPGAAGGLEACSDAQMGFDQSTGLFTNVEPSCPDGSKIGTVDVKTPLLKEHLTGDVVLGTPKSTDPQSGQMFRLFIVARNADRGLLVKLYGTAVADPATGQLTATFASNPQLPFDTLKLAFKGGARGMFATPRQCGTQTTNATFTPWSAPFSPDVKPSDAFTVGCTPGLGWFGPLFTAGTTSPVAGASTSFVLRTDKPDGQSDMNAIALSLPEGLLASLKGNVGRQIGTASVGAGPGPSPFWLSGPVVLEGPYGDAPFSLRVTVPVIAGPFNLGNVVVRQKIYVDPHDAHVTVVSDPLPTIWHGIPVRLQDLRVNIDKAGFMRNPTSCAVKSIGGTLGADTGQTAAVASRFEVGACASLPLRPKMAMELKGSKQINRGKHPEFSTTLTQQPGESNLKSVKVRLPLSLALDPDNAEALCKPEQAAAKACPAASIVGHATAISPVLNQPLKGDVFFVEGTRQSKEGRTVKTLPKLWVALRGEVAIDVWADSSISEGKYLVTTFPFVPDAPISSFKLDINGGDHGILAVTGDVGANLCQRRLITDASYVGQNGKQVESKVHMDSPCGFKVRQKSVSISHAKVTVSGIGAGKLTISGKGIHKASRAIKHSKVATIKPRLTATGKRLYKGRKAIRLKVSFNPRAKGEKTKHAKTTVKRAKKSSSTRAHRTR